MHVLTESGEQCVMSSGLPEMLRSSVDNWALCSLSLALRNSVSYALALCYELN